MQRWLQGNLELDFKIDNPNFTKEYIRWPKVKPPARLSLDDRCIMFNGVFPDLTVLDNFQPWNRRDK